MKNTLSAAVFLVLVLAVLSYSGLFVKLENIMEEEHNDSKKEQAVFGSVEDYHADKASCEAAGGKWEPAGLQQIERCNLPTSDAGKVCRSASECERGVCFTDKIEMRDVETEGRCYGWSLSIGTCLNRVEEGKTTGVLCID